MNPNAWVARSAHVLGKIFSPALCERDNQQWQERGNAQISHKRRKVEVAGRLRAETPAQLLLARMTSRCGTVMFSGWTVLSGL